jgi:hypothetical protein
LSQSAGVGGPQPAEPFERAQVTLAGAFAVALLEEVVAELARGSSQRRWRLELAG